MSDTERVRKVFAVVEPIKERGKHPFPIDMLRYDRAFPARETDSHKIERTLQQFVESEGKLTVVCKYTAATFAQARHSAFQFARWESMGWKVVFVGKAHECGDYLRGRDDHEDEVEGLH
jgi:hypothetical protein